MVGGGWAAIGGAPITSDPQTVATADGHEQVFDTANGVIKQSWWSPGNGASAAGEPSSDSAARGARPARSAARVPATVDSPAVRVASMWSPSPRATPKDAILEFYIDENLTGRTIRRFIADLGYTVHTPAEVFGRERLRQRLEDEDWLPMVGRNGWVVFGRDWHTSWIASLSFGRT